MLKGIRVSALFVLCLSLVAFAPVYAGQGNEKAPAFSAAIDVPTVKSLGEQDLSKQSIDLSRMPVLLDGVPLPEGPQTKRALRDFYLVVDHEEGVINAFRTRREFDDHLQATPALDCNPQTKANETCIFFNGPNCTGTRAVAVACGFLAANITGPNGLNGPIASFIHGCGVQAFIPNANCTVPPNGVGFQGVVGACYNIGPNAFNCAGCFEPVVTP
jgi:hypothetical protein